MTRSDGMLDGKIPGTSAKVVFTKVFIDQVPTPRGPNCPPPPPRVHATPLRHNLTRPNRRC